MMDRRAADNDRASVPKSQTGFIDFLVRPLLGCFVSLCHGDNSRHLSLNLDNNYAIWKSRIP